MTTFKTAESPYKSDNTASNMCGFTLMNNQVGVVVAQVLSKLPGIVDLQLEKQLPIPELLVDVDRANAESPFGAPIAHGFLTLSLIPALSKQCYVVENAKMGVNYGLNKVRFIAVVRVGSRVRLRSESCCTFTRTVWGSVGSLPTKSPRPRWPK